jgi:outer membrane protein TolC
MRLSSNPVWSLASSLTAPLINFCRLRSEIDASNARANAALLQYENATNLALQETKTALSDYLNGVNTVKAQEEALINRQEAVRLARIRFDRGLTDMTDLTTAQAELDEATLSLITLQTQTAIAYIRLQKALTGYDIEKR